MVDEEPPGLDGDEDILGEVAEGEEVVGLEAGGAEDGVEFGTEGEVGASEVGDGDVEAVWRRVGAEVGEEDGRAEGVEVWNRCGLPVDDSVVEGGGLPADSLPMTKVKGFGLRAGGEANTFLAFSKKALSDTRLVDMVTTSVFKPQMTCFSRQMPELLWQMPQLRLSVPRSRPG